MKSSKPSSAPSRHRTVFLSRPRDGVVRVTEHLYEGHDEQGRRKLKMISARTVKTKDLPAFRASLEAEGLKPMPSLADLKRMAGLAPKG